jgi:hypothetical protein
MPDGSDGDRSTPTTREASVAASTTAEKAAKVRMVEEVVTAKAAEEAMMVKAAADKAVAVKAVVVKMTADEAAGKTADQGAAGVKATMESAGFGSSSSPTPTEGTKRVTTLGGSTPPSKRFYCAWKLWYAEHLCSRIPLFIYLYYI